SLRKASIKGSLAPVVTGDIQPIRAGDGDCWARATDDHATVVRLRAGMAGGCGVSFIASLCLRVLGWCTATIALQRAQLSTGGISLRNLRPEPAFDGDVRRASKGGITCQRRAYLSIHGSWSSR